MTDYGKLPPQAVDLEEAVLGAMLIDKQALSEVVDILVPDSFYKEQHKIVFEAILSLNDDNSPVDILTLANRLKSRQKLEEVGGAYFISQLTNRVASGANAEYHARIIEQHHMRRKMILAGSEMVKNAYDDSADVFELMENADKSLQSIVDRIVDGKARPINDVLKKVQEEYLARQKSGGVTGIPTSSVKLDAKIGGWNKSDLVILAARPGMGKTAESLSIARKAAESGYPVAFFSLEMSESQLVTRIIAAESSTEISMLMRGEMDASSYKSIIEPTARKLAKLPIYFVDKGSLSIREFKMRSRRMSKEHGIKLIIIDYLQLMTGDTNRNNNREQEISYISRNLKAIAKELNVTVIALSQLSRQVEQRGGDKRPMLSDLRESGSLEQDADMVLFLYRPEYYGITQDEDGNSTEGVLETIVAKFRNGNPGSIFERCELRYMQTGEYVKTPNEVKYFDDEDYERSNSSLMRGKENPF